MCPSRLKVGDQVFWTAGDADLAPLLGEFISVSEIRGPKFTLKAGVWTMIRSGGTPLKAFVKFAEEEREVDYVDITIITKWPVLLP